MSIRLPSRYEDLDVSYRGKIIPNRPLIDLVKRAHVAMGITGGVRFIPAYGRSGAGKSCASRELNTHLPDVSTFVLDRGEIESKDQLLERVRKERALSDGQMLVAIIDQYEENVLGKEKIPTQFVEHISLLDRAELRGEKVLFIWLTTSRAFQQQLESATSRNSRLLMEKGFEIQGPEQDKWPDIIHETFSFHNDGVPLADYGLLKEDIQRLAKAKESLGTAIESLVDELAKHVAQLQSLSEYQVILVWPVADSARSQRIAQFTKARSGYQLNWDSWYSELNEDDRRTLPLGELNRARLYFDVRLVPIRAADLHALCADLDDEDKKLGKASLDRLSKTHFFHVVSGSWSDYSFAPMRERESERAEKARAWYEGITNQPTKIGRRLARILRELGLDAEYEQEIKTKYSSVRADILAKAKSSGELNKIIELKVFSSENTMPSSIKDQIKITLRRHAQLAGFLQRQ